MQLYAQSLSSVSVGMAHMVGSVLCKNCGKPTNSDATPIYTMTPCSQLVASKRCLLVWATTSNEGMLQWYLLSLGSLFNRAVQLRAFVGSTEA